MTPAQVPWIVLAHGTAVGDDFAQPCEAAVLLGAIPRVVPADEVEQLVACGEPHLAQALVRLNAGRKPDLVSIRPVPAPAASVVPKERTARAKPAHLGGEALERAIDEERSGRDVEIGLGAPELLAESCELQRSKSAFCEREHDMSHGIGDCGALQLAVRRGHRAEYQPSRATRSARSAGFSVSSSARRSAARASSVRPSARSNSARVA